MARTILFVAFAAFVGAGCQLGQVEQQVAEGRVQNTETYLDTLAQEIELFYMTHQRLPKSLNEFAVVDPTTGEVLASPISADRWGRPYGYQQLGEKEYRIWSSGPDGTPGTPDDIVKHRGRRAVKASDLPGSPIMDPN